MQRSSAIGHHNQAHSQVNARFTMYMHGQKLSRKVQVRLQQSFMDACTHAAHLHAHSHSHTHDIECTLDSRMHVYTRANINLECVVGDMHVHVHTVHVVLSITWYETQMSDHNKQNVSNQT